MSASRSCIGILIVSALPVLFAEIGLRFGPWIPFALCSIGAAVVSGLLQNTIITRREQRGSGAIPWPIWCAAAAAIGVVSMAVIGIAIRRTIDRVPPPDAQSWIDRDRAIAFYDFLIFGIANGSVQFIGLRNASRWSPAWIGGVVVGSILVWAGFSIPSAFAGVAGCAANGVVLIILLNFLTTAPKGKAQTTS